MELLQQEVNEEASSLHRNGTEESNNGRSAVCKVSECARVDITHKQPYSQQASSQNPHLYRHIQLASDVNQREPAFVAWKVQVRLSKRSAVGGTSHKMKVIFLLKENSLR